MSQNNTVTTDEAILRSAQKRNGRYEMLNFLRQYRKPEDLPSSLKSIRYTQEKYLGEMIDNVHRSTFTAKKSTRFCGFPMQFGEAASEGQKIMLRQLVSENSTHYRASVTNVQHCGGSWNCPVCSAKISAQRQLDLEHIFKSHMAAGKRIGFLTLTMRHTAQHGLGFMFEALKDAWRSATNGAAWKRDREMFGLEHYVRILEITRGANGWHLHAHVALLMEDPKDRKDEFVTGKSRKDGSVMYRARTPQEMRDYQDMQKLGANMFHRWQQSLAKAGTGKMKGTLKPNQKHGFMVDDITPALASDAAMVSAVVAEYLAKTGLHHDFENPMDVAAAHGLTSADVANARGEAAEFLAQSQRVALEMTGAANKTTKQKGRTPWQILEDFRADYLSGNSQTLRENYKLWFEYEMETKGRRQVVYSRGLRAQYGLKPAESDERLANNANPESTLELCTLDRKTYSAIYRDLGQIKLFQAAEEEGIVGVRRVIAFYTLEDVKIENEIAVSKGQVLLRHPVTKIPYKASKNALELFQELLSAKKQEIIPATEESLVETVLAEMEAAGVSFFEMPPGVPDIPFQSSYGQFLLTDICLLYEWEQVRMDSLTPDELNNYGSKEVPLVFPDTDSMQEFLYDFKVALGATIAQTDFLPVS